MNYRFVFFATALTLSLVAIAGAAAWSTESNTNTLQRLNTIVIPELKVRDASLATVAKQLTELSARYSKDGTGVTFVVQTEPAVSEVKTPRGLDAGILQAIEEIKTNSYPEVFDTTQLPITNRLVTLSLRNIPLTEAVRYIASLANLHDAVQGDKVVFGNVALKLEVRVYRSREKDMGEVAAFLRNERFAKFSHSPNPVRVIENQKLLVFLAEPAELDEMEDLWKANGSWPAILDAFKQSP